MIADLFTISFEQADEQNVEDVTWWRSYLLKN